MIYLNCGVIDVSSPELMAVALRELASKLPSQLGVQLTRTILSKLVPISKLLALDSKSQDVAAQGEAVLNEFMKEFFPKDSATDLNAVIKSYKLLLENMPPGQKEPVIIIGALLEKWHVAVFTFKF